TLNLTAAKADGSRQIVVSGLRKDKPRSFILRFRDGDFAVRDKNIKLLLKVARIPPDYDKRLVGQKLDDPGTFANGVSLVQRESDTYKLGRTLELPRAANVFNFTYLPGKEGNKVVVADSSDQLRLYFDGEIQASTDKAFAGSAVKIREKKSLPGLEDSREDPPSYYFLPTRLLPCDLNVDGEFELLVNRSVSSTSKYLANQRSFSEGSIHSLYWDGLGLSTAWKTGTIKGAVQDYGLGDMNNDGTLELYVCITTSPGTFSWGGKKTILLAYPLELSEESRGEIFRP
ncbi:MAG: VCBS repeat-containing protein, partial [Desulfohalobiaceae bacterium]